jgi:hypothetical protein
MRDYWRFLPQTTLQSAPIALHSGFIALHCAVAIFAMSSFLMKPSVFFL